MEVLARAVDEARLMGAPKPGPEEDAIWEEGKIKLEKILGLSLEGVRSIARDLYSNFR